jgi:hypothetical protein
MDSESLVAISRFLGKEFTCKECGTISGPEDVDIIPKVFGNGKLNYSATCPDCGRHLAYMRQNCLPTFFFSKKVGMVLAGDLDLNTLEWLLSVNHKALRDKSVLESVQMAIIEKQGADGRKVAPFKLTAQEDAEEREKGNLNEYLGLILELTAERDELTLRTVEMDAVQVDYAIKRLKALGTALKKLETKRDNILGKKKAIKSPGGN